MLTVKILCVGNLKEKYLRDACAEYEKRLSPYCKLAVTELKEGASLAPYIPSSGKCFKIALCIDGKGLSSEELADKITEIQNRGYSELLLIIGQFDGIPEEIVRTCDFRLSFSKMTFPHQLMRVILLEQLYRSFTIINGGKYHK